MLMRFKGKSLNTPIENLFCFGIFLIFWEEIFVLIKYPFASLLLSLCIVSHAVEFNILHRLMSLAIVPLLSF